MHLYLFHLLFLCKVNLPTMTAMSYPYITKTHWGHRAASWSDEDPQEHSPARGSCWDRHRANDR